MERTSPPFALSDEEYALVECVAEAIVPAGEDPASEPGAREVGVKNYFDSVLLEMPPARRERVRETLAMIQRESAGAFGGRRFQDLTGREREAVFGRFLSEGGMKARFLEVRAICVEGFYSDYRDPGYEGVSAWQWLGYEGKRVSDVKKDWSFLRVYREGNGKKEEGGAGR